MQKQTQEPNKTQQAVQVLDLARFIFVNKLDVTNTNYSEQAKQAILASATFDEVANNFLAQVTKEQIK